jgi:predicted enzyme related to lactoylglutathione lyase
MERVTGFGGIFFRAKDPELLAQWYQDHLGIKSTPESYDEEPWCQEAGPTVFAPFALDTDYFGRAEQQWMTNLRVRDLDAMVAQLRAANINVSMDPQQYPNGRFARLHDPEGNPIELWQPK